MKLRSSIFSRRAALLGFATLALAFPAAAQLPPSNSQLVITRPGTYVLTRDISVVSGDAVVVRAAGVTLDLNGHSVTTQTMADGRGIFVDGVNGVQIKNGKVSAFNANVAATNALNLTIEDLQIVGLGVAPSGGPREIGILLIGVKGAKIKENTLTDLNLGIFVRGGESRGNRIFNNTVTGSDIAANNLLGICYNPLPGGVGTDPGPRGDLIYNNHVSGYTNGLSFSPGSKANIVRENSIAYFGSAFSAGTVFGPLDTVSDGNIATKLP